MAERGSAPHSTRSNERVFARQRHVINGYAVVKPAQTGKALALSPETLEGVTAWNSPWSLRPRFDPH
jgi:hypothetical protein